MKSGVAVLATLLLAGVGTYLWVWSQHSLKQKDEAYAMLITELRNEVDYLQEATARRVLIAEQLAEMIGPIPEPPDPLDACRGETVTLQGAPGFENWHYQMSHEHDIACPKYEGLFNCRMAAPSGQTRPEADLVIFHGHVHGPEQIETYQKTGLQKFMLLDIEPLDSWHPRLSSLPFWSTIDYVATYRLDSDVPMIYPPALKEELFEKNITW